MNTDKTPIYPIQVWDVTEENFDIKNKGGVSCLLLPG